MSHAPAEPESSSGSWRARLSVAARRGAIGLERQWDVRRVARRGDRPPSRLRIVSHGGHGTPRQVVVRGRVLDGPEPTTALVGESTWAAVRRTARRFWSDELPDVPLLVRLGDVEARTVTDHDGYFEVSLDPVLAEDAGPLVRGTVTLAGDYRGLASRPEVPIEVAVSGGTQDVAVISDVDDTILLTGVERVLRMIWQTVAGSSLTRETFPGAPAFYRALARVDEVSTRPVFYVSSSPWNLHDFLAAFLSRHGFPPGPLLLRDLLGVDARRSHGSHKHARIDEVMTMHPDLRFVLIGDSGEHDPAIYAEVVRRYPGRVLAVYIREVRAELLLAPEPDEHTADPDGHPDRLPGGVPILYAADTAAMARHAAELGLLPHAAAESVVAAVSAGR